MASGSRRPGLDLRSNRGRTQSSAAQFEVRACQTSMRTGTHRHPVYFVPRQLPGTTASGLPVIMTFERIERNTPLSLLAFLTYDVEL